MKPQVIIFYGDGGGFAKTLHDRLFARGCEVSRLYATSERIRSIKAGQSEELLPEGLDFFLFEASEEPNGSLRIEFVDALGPMRLLEALT